MKKVLFLSAMLAATFCSCGNLSANNNSTDTDSAQAEISAESTSAPAPKPIKGYESSEEFGIKAWIEKGVAKWTLVNRDAWVQFTGNPDFTRVQDNDPYTVEMPEAAIGVKILRHSESSQSNAVLCIISESGHVYTMQLNEAVACVVLAAGKLPYGENVIGFTSEQQGNRYVVSTIQSDGGSVEVSLYGYDVSEYGLRDCGITVGESEYALSMQSSWACTLRDGQGKTYSGYFTAVGDAAPNTWQLTFTETIDYTEDGNHHNAIDPITVTIDWNSNAETLEFSENSLGIPSGKPLAVDVWPLYE